jgi:carbon monoxide dehydrogenase subunit G
MMEIEDSVFVSSPRQAVFRFAARPESMPLWNPAVRESKVIGRLEAGASVVQLIELFGRRFETIYEVSRYEPFRRVTYTSTGGPMDVQGSMEFSTEPGGTVVHWIVCGDCRGFFRAGQSILMGLGRREMRDCLERLKRVLEEAEAA